LAGNRHITELNNVNYSSTEQTLELAIALAARGREPTPQIDCFLTSGYEENRRIDCFSTSGAIGTAVAECFRLFGMS
jgi:hypothetical protein